MIIHVKRMEVLKMAKKVLLIIPPERFNEDELLQPKSALENANMEVTVASTTTGTIVGDNNGTIHIDVTLNDLDLKSFDAVSVIGGSGTNDFLWNNESVQELLKEAYSQKRLIAGICAGAVTVAETGLLQGRNATCYPVDVQKEKLKEFGVTYIGEHVIAHEDIITGDGPDGAKAFGEALVANLTK